MKTHALAASLTAALIALTGCYEGEKTEAGPKTYDVEAIIKAGDLSDAEKAEMLAQIGESLTTPVAFMYADEVLTQALKFDANNPRAQLYKHLVAPAMKLKGGIRGMRPLVAKMSDEAQGAFDMMVTDVEQNESLYNFLVDGPADINNESKAQQFLDQVYQSQNDLRVFLRGFKRNVIKISPVIIDASTNEYLSQCQVTAVGPRAGYHQRYEASECPFEMRVSTTIDSADIEVIQHAAAGAQIATIFATSYDLTGGVAYEHFAQGRKRTMSESVRFVNQLSQLGQLRANAAIKLIHAMGTDVYAGARWAQSYQDRLCPKGHYAVNRPGRLIEGGLCVQDLPDRSKPRAESVLRVFAAALAGTNTSLGIRDGKLHATELTRGGGYDYQTRADVLAFITNPIADLKSQLPTQFDRCGQPLNVGDKNLGGIFVDGNANDVAARLNLFGKNCN